MMVWIHFRILIGCLAYILGIDKMSLAFSTLWTNAADDKLIIFFLFFPRKQNLTFYANCFHWRQFA